MWEWDDKYNQLLDRNIGKVKKKRTLHTGGELCTNDFYLFLEEEGSEAGS